MLSLFITVQTQIFLPFFALFYYYLFIYPFFQEYMMNHKRLYSAILSEGAVFIILYYIK
jgi:hypothetical protein